jgi:8-oxo-dGTP pyrophosphatase MutT (NUDIX family)
VTPPSEIPETVAAATVVVLRDGPDGIETLLLRRNSKLGFGGGNWVFPGGRVDAGDLDPDRPDDEEAAARRAAVREAAEEANLVVEPDALVVISHWTPPMVVIKRFATWFFLAEAPATLVEVDGGEIVDHLWVTPASALERHAAGEVELMPPTWVTLHRLSQHADVASALVAVAAEPVDHYVTKFVELDGQTFSLWAGDAGYEAEDPSLPGPRHRLHVTGLPWRYERS